jgi:hypothetical protein
VRAEHAELQQAIPCQQSLCSLQLVAIGLQARWESECRHKACGCLRCA